MLISARYAAVLAALVVVSVGCSSSKKPTAQVSLSGATQPTTAGTSAASSPKPKPKPVYHGISPTAYRAKLAAAGRPLDRALSALPDAGSLSVLTSRLRSATHAAGAAATLLAAVKPPRPVRTEHARVVAGLRQLDTDLGATAEHASEQTLCASSSALSSLARLTGRKRLATAAHALAVKGYHLRATVPSAPAHGTPRPGTGTFLRDGNRSGNGQLTIENGSEGEAVLTLAVGSQAQFSVFIRRGADYKIPSISDGRYAVYYAGGTAWDGVTQAFARNCSFSRFDKSLTFTTTSSVGFVQYSTWTLTLYPVIGGNATTSKVDPRNYPH